MNGEYHGLVAMIPSTRPGWEVVTAPVPCLIGKFHRLNKQHVAFYDVDSPFLSVNYPELVAELGDSWEWPAEDLCQQTVRMFHSPAGTHQCSRSCSSRFLCMFISDFTLFL